MNLAPSDLLSDDTLRPWVDVLVRFVEAAGALVIFIGAALAAIRFVVDGLSPDPPTRAVERMSEPLVLVEGL